MTVFDQRLRAKIKFEEGVRSTRYFCSQGKATIGVGFNLERGDARALVAALGADYDLVLAGKAALTELQINALLDDDIAACVRDLETIFANYGELPDDVRLVLIDMRYQLGLAGLLGFKHTLAQIQSQTFNGAAANLRKSLLYKQTPKRAERNAQILENAQTRSVQRK